MIRLIGSNAAMMTLPSTVWWSRVPLDMRVPSVNLAGLPGAVRAGLTRIDTRRFELEGGLYYRNPATIRQRVDDLTALLQHPPIQVYQHHADERFLWAWPLGLPQDWIDARREVRLRVPFVALDPYFYGSEQVVTEAINSTQHNWAIYANGTAPTFPDVMISVTAGNIVDPVIAHTVMGQVIALTGTFGAGDEILIDTSRYEVQLNGERALGLAHDDWLISGFSLYPGSNDVQLQASGSFEIEVTMTFRPRWL